MAVPRGTRFQLDHGTVFPQGAAVVGPVTPDMEYVSMEDKARGRQPQQRKDDVTGLPQWKVTVTDPSADKDRDRSVTVVVLDKVQPVPPPAAVSGFDLRPVFFEGLTVEPRVMGEKFKYQGWVLRATAMRPPSGAVKPAGTAKSAAGQPGEQKPAA